MPPITLMRQMKKSRQSISVTVPVDVFVLMKLWNLAADASVDLPRSHQTKKS